MKIRDAVTMLMFLILCLSCNKSKYKDVEYIEVEKSIVPEEPEQPKSVDATPPPTTAELANAILTAKCASCHSITNPQGGFGTVLNVDEMIKSGIYVRPGNAKESSLITRLAPAGNMPPNGSITPEEIEILSTWINEIEVDPVIPLTDPGMISLIRTDLETNVQAAQQVSTRYFNLQVSNNAGMDDVTKDFMIKGLAKALNSLSNSPNIVIPQAIDENGLIYRVNLTDYLIDPVRFDEVMADFYPFSSEFVAVAGDNQSAVVAADHAAVTANTGTFRYNIRADWFVASFGLPVIYARLLNLPATLGELEANLGVDRLAGIQANLALRSGFRNSGVSSQNRVIERLRSSTTNRFYWISYDFADNNEGQQNLFNFPLGPAGIGFEEKSFDHDGGEVIFQLPNGMFGYYLNLADGSAIHKGPVNIVKQEGGPSQFFQSILNGVSCMSCHGQGLLYKKDEIRGFVATSNDFLAAEKDKVLALYPEEAQLKAAMDEDNAPYFKALEEMQIPLGSPDPIDSAFRYYYKNLFRKDVQAELGVTETVLNTLLAQEPFKLSWVSIVNNTGSITREEFNILYNSAMTAVRTTISHTPPVFGDHLVTPACMVADPALMDSCTKLTNPPEEPPPAAAQ
ncbi:MAG: cytochrome c [Pseudobacteriovorax sp.]|nr:cytochrome c [Pseudobacteriovorax sp.]